MKSGIPKPRSINKIYELKEYQTNKNNSQDQDIIIRQSPQPTLSTNRISKSKSTKQSDFKTLTRIKSSSQYITTQHVFDTYRTNIDNNKKISIIINKLTNNWKTITREELLNVKIEEDLIQNNENIKNVKLKLNFLFSLREILQLKKKIMDTKLNRQLINLENKDSTQNINKGLIIQILLNKLQKKVFIQSLNFNYMLNKLKISLKKQKAVIKKAKILIQQLGSIIQRIKLSRLQQIFNKMKQDKQISELFSVASSGHHELEMSTSIKNNNMNLVENIEQMNRLIRILENDLDKYNKKWEQNTILKWKNIFFFKFKIMFLRRYRQKLCVYNSNMKKKKYILNAIKQYKHLNQQQLKQQQQQFKQQQKNLKQYKKTLKNILKSNRVKYFFTKFNCKKILNNIYKDATQIYYNFLKKKTLYALSSYKNKNNIQIQQTPSHNNYQTIDSYQYSFKNQNKQVQIIGQQYEQEERRVQQIEQDQYHIFSCELFHSHNLKYRVYNYLKRSYIFGRVNKTLQRISVASALREMMNIYKEEGRNESKLLRFQERKNRLLLFKYYGILKQNNISYDDKLKLHLHIKVKNRSTKQLVFSILKIQFKKYLIKLKKIQKLHQFYLKKYTLSDLKLNIKTNIQSNIKSHQIIQFRFRKYSRSFLKKFFNYTLNQIKQRKKIAFYNYIQTERLKKIKTNIFNNWKIYITRKRNFRIILTRYRKLKEKQMKKNIFRVLLKQVYKNISNYEQSAISQSQNESLNSRMKQSMMSGSEHRYWLQEYYKKLLTVIK